MGPALRRGNKRCSGRADVGIGPYESVTRSAVVIGRSDVGIAPYGGETEIHLLSGGRGRTPPLRRATRGAEEESPSHGCAVPAPFRQGAMETGDADCHSQCAHWPRNDSFLQGVSARLGGGVGAACPTERSKKCSGAGRCGHRPLRKGKRSLRAGRRGRRPLRKITRSAVVIGRGDVGIGLYGGETEIHLLSGGVEPRPYGGL